jgi:hypothetical protein
LEKLIFSFELKESQKSSVIQMNKKTIYAIVAVLIIIIVVAVAAYALLYSGGGGGTTTPTPTPTATVGGGVGNATTLTFSANVTSQGSTIEYKWSGKNIHSSNITIRVDFAGYSYLLDASKEKSWSSSDNGTTWKAGNFTADWPVWGAQWQEDVDALVGHWSGSGDYSFTDAQHEAVTLFNIVVNPTIPGSTFTAS